MYFCDEEVYLRRGDLSPLGCEATLNVGEKQASALHSDGDKSPRHKSMRYI